MLTNDDLQQIAKLLQPIIDQLKEHGQLLHEHSNVLHEHSNVLHEHSGILKEHSTILHNHDKKLDNQAKMLKSLKKDQNLMLTMLDKEQMGQRKRIKKIETQIGIYPLE